MDERFSRTAALIGNEAVKKLNNSRVAVFGIGGVGGYAVEALARAGIGSLDLIDADTVSISNINRQIIATERTIGQAKCDAAKERVLEINPNIKICSHNLFFSEDNAEQFDFTKYDYVIDAIDTVTSKLLLIEKASMSGTKIISSMGTGNKLDPTRLEIADISKTSVCPLARVMRTELRKRGINHIKVLFSKEIPIKANIDDESAPKTRHAPASISTVPSAAGLIIAAEVIKDLIAN